MANSLAVSLTFDQLSCNFKHIGGVTDSRSHNKHITAYIDPSKFPNQNAFFLENCETSSEVGIVMTLFIAFFNVDLCKITIKMENSETEKITGAFFHF